MSENERGLSEERKAYLEDKIKEKFKAFFEPRFGVRCESIEGILDILEKKRVELSTDRLDKYPDGASKEDALVTLFQQMVDWRGSGEYVFEFALLWGERFGANEYDADVTNANLLNNSRIRAGSRAQRLRPEDNQ